jgi:hypothetical protein
LAQPLIANEFRCEPRLLRLHQQFMVPQLPQFDCDCRDTGSISAQRVESSEKRTESSARCPCVRELSADDVNKEALQWFHWSADGARTLPVKHIASEHATSTTALCYEIMSLPPAIAVAKRLLRIAGSK